MDIITFSADVERLIIWVTTVQGVRQYCYNNRQEFDVKVKELKAYGGGRCCGQ